MTPDALVLGVRPQDVRPTEGVGALSFEVDVVEAMGFEAYAHGQIGDGRAVMPGTFIARLDGEAADRARRGAKLSFAVEHAHLFDAQTERAIGRVSSVKETGAPPVASAAPAAIAEALSEERV